MASLGATIAVHVSLPKEFIIHENDLDSHIFIIRRGEVRVFTESCGEITRLRVSHYFGEIPYLLPEFDLKTSPISAYTGTFVETYALHANHFVKV